MSSNKQVDAINSHLPPDKVLDVSDKLRALPLSLSGKGPSGYQKAVAFKTDLVYVTDAEVQTDPDISGNREPRATLIVDKSDISAKTTEKDKIHKDRTGRKDRKEIKVGEPEKSTVFNSIKSIDTRETGQDTSSTPGPRERAGSTNTEDIDHGYSSTESVEVSPDEPEKLIQLYPFLDSESKQDIVAVIQQEIADQKAELEAIQFRTQEPDHIHKYNLMITPEEVDAQPWPDILRQQSLEEAQNGPPGPEGPRPILIFRLTETLNNLRQGTNVYHLVLKMVDKAPTDYWRSLKQHPDPEVGQAQIQAWYRLLDWARARLQVPRMSRTQRQSGPTLFNIFQKVMFLVASPEDWDSWGIKWPGFKEAWSQVIRGPKAPDLTHQISILWREVVCDDPDLTKTSGKRVHFALPTETRVGPPTTLELHDMYAQALEKKPPSSKATHTPVLMYMSLLRYLRQRIVSQPRRLSELSKSELMHMIRG